MRTLALAGKIGPAFGTKVEEMADGTLIPMRYSSISVVDGSTYEQYYATRGMRTWHGKHVNAVKRARRGNQIERLLGYVAQDYAFPPFDTTLSNLPVMQRHYLFCCRQAEDAGTNDIEKHDAGCSNAMPTAYDVRKSAGL